MRYAAKVDANQKEIVAALRKFGAIVLITSQLKNAFDLLVGYNGKLYIVEVKDGTKPTSARKLTAGELKCKEAFESVGITYHVVTSSEGAISILE